MVSRPSRRGPDALSLALLVAVVLGVAAVVGALVVGASPGSANRFTPLSQPHPGFVPRPGDHTLVIDGVQFTFPADDAVFQGDGLGGCWGLPVPPPNAPGVVYVLGYPYGSVFSCPAMIAPRSPSPRPTTSPSTVQLLFSEVPPEIASGFIKRPDTTISAAGQHVDEARGAKVGYPGGLAVYFRENRLLLEVGGGTRAAQQLAVDRVLASAVRLAGPDAIANDPYAYLTMSPSPAG